MKAVGVIGAGQMGAGIAQVSAQAGYRVFLADVSRDVAEKSKAGIGKQLDRLVSKEKVDVAARDAALALIEPVGDYAQMAEAGLIVEAATENESIKRKIFEAAGFEWRGAGCSMCLAMNPDKLKGREICASSSNRNFKGRQGSPTGRTLLMSPAMVAAAAVKGCVTDVRQLA